MIRRRVDDNEVKKNDNGHLDSFLDFTQENVGNLEAEIKRGQEEVWEAQMKNDGRNHRF
jgi:hypothetical protein